MKTSARLCVIFIAGLFELVATASWYTASDGHRYYIEGSASYNWLEALDQCSRQGLQLVVVDSSSKNKALVALLRSVFGSSRDLWIGHHDEFNKEKDKNRKWYSASSGQPVSFGYWDSGEPNNKKGKHCAQIYRKADFKWRDEDCDTNFFGYICEEHYLITQCPSNVETKRQKIYEKNSQLSNDFLNTQNQIKQINENTRQDTDNLLGLWEKSTDDILGNFQKSLNDLILKKPYLQAVIADVGESITELALDAKRDMAKTTQETRQLIENVHVNGETSINTAHSDFAEKLTTNKNEVDKILEY